MIPVAEQLPPGSRATVMVRPQYVTLAPSGGVLTGRITAITYIGDVVQIAVSGDRFALTAERGTADPIWRGFAVGQDVGVAWPASAALVFPENANGR